MTARAGRLQQRAFANDFLRVSIATPTPDKHFVASIELRTAGGWETLLRGVEGREFSASFGNANASTCCAAPLPSGGWRIEMSCLGATWEARETIALLPAQPWLRREQTWRILAGCEGAIHPGWQLPATSGLRYTFPLFAHERPLAGLPAMRADVAWALPFPFHVWHAGDWVALYGVDRSRSGGTLDFQPAPEAGGTALDGSALDGVALRVYVPDTTAQIPDLSEQFYKYPLPPKTARFERGTEIVLSEVIGARVLEAGQEPLLEAERLAADVLLAPRAMPDLQRVAAGIAAFYPRCELWEPDALGEGRGWFLNMWTYPHGGTPQRTGPGGGYFDLGWGEGIAAETFVGLTRHWQRTGRADLLGYVDEMTRSLGLFQCGAGPDAPFFDRSDGRRFGDFGLQRRFWTHSLGHLGSQLLRCYLENPGYPTAEARQEWGRVAASIARYCARQQTADGDLPDLVDDAGRAIVTGKRRIAARVVVASLWSLMSRVTGDAAWLERAVRLARAVQPEIDAYAFYNQMIDALSAPIDLLDGEAAYYALEGLVPLYEATGAPWMLALCQKAVAFGLCWTYFYDLPSAYRGVARGGQACRMPDFPLIYPIGPAKAVEPLLRLARVTGDALYARMAGEMVGFIGQYQIDQPDRPWHGGMVHAFDQHSGRFWGPDKCGQVDTGMATGNSLAAIECWLDSDRGLRA